MTATTARKTKARKNAELDFERLVDGQLARGVATRAQAETNVIGMLRMVAISFAQHTGLMR